MLGWWRPTSGRAAPRLVAANAARTGAEGVAVVVADGTRPPWRSGSFDRVLVDAPCSGLGTLRRRADLRWRVEPEAVERLAALQRRLLGAAADLVRPGGMLVYSVCTLTVAESTGVDGWLAAERPDLVPVDPPDGAVGAVGARGDPPAAGGGHRRHVPVPLPPGRLTAPSPRPTARPREGRTGRGEAMGSDPASPRPQFRIRNP